MSAFDDLSILYAEDDEETLREVANFLERRFQKVYFATDGRTALKIFDEVAPDIVVTDILMPKLSGLEVAEQVKRRDASTPVIFTTAFDEKEHLLRAIDLGIDAYVLKPIRFAPLEQALGKAAVTLHHCRNERSQAAELSLYHERNEEERQLLMELMYKMMHPESVPESDLHYHLEQTEGIGGDLIAIQRYRNRLYLMLADSIGHGLPAALNLLPINHIFYSMAEKGLPIGMIVEEMNSGLINQLPLGNFVAALVACIDNDNRLVELWNGGIPPALFLQVSGEIDYRFLSRNPPLGIHGHDFAATTEVIQWRQPGQLIVCSDGLLEAETSVGQAFGEQRYLIALKEAPPEHRFDHVLRQLSRHLEGNRHHDDISFLVVNADGSPRSPGYAHSVTSA